MKPHTDDSNMTEDEGSHLKNPTKLDPLMIKTHDLEPPIKLEPPVIKSEPQLTAEPFVLESLKEETHAGIDGKLSEQLIYVNMDHSYSLPYDGIEIEQKCIVPYPSLDESGSQTYESVSFHSKSGQIECSVCEEKYDNITEYTHHLNKHLQEPDQLVEQKVEVSFPDLTVDMRRRSRIVYPIQELGGLEKVQHTQNNMMTVKCINCDWKCASPSNLIASLAMLKHTTLCNPWEKKHNHRFIPGNNKQAAIFNGQMDVINHRFKPIDHIKESPQDVKHCMENADNQRRKSITHAKNAEITCMLCKAKFNREDYLHHHMQEHGWNSPINMIKYPKVNLLDISTVPSFQLYSKKNIRKNVRTLQTVTRVKPHRNWIIGDKFECKLNSHDNNGNKGEHFSTLGQGISCAICREQVNTRENKWKVFSCTLCDKSFLQIGSLTRHVDAIHHELKLFSCAMCEKSFARKNSLAMHIDAVHNKLKPFTCSLCDKSFVTKGARTTHIEVVHNKRKSFTCTLCNTSFAKKKNMTRHVDAVHNKLRPFMCTLCKKCFSQKAHMYKHMDIVHQRKPF